MSQPSSTHRSRTLVESVVADLRRRLAAGEWDAGERLPGEHQLAETYAVSRATIRSALSELEGMGLTLTRHGSGTFATSATTGIRSDLRRLESMTTTIAEAGHTPTIRYRSKQIRPADQGERDALDLDEGDLVLATERTLLADDKVVAFSQEALSMAFLPADIDPDDVEGSLFNLMDEIGHMADSAITEIHAAGADEFGWGNRPRDTPYVRLYQIHYTAAHSPLVVSNTYFIEGRFQFSLIRVR